MDAVYVVGEQDPNPELIYSLRSLEANVPHGNVFIAGYKPVDIQNVIYIPLPQGESKWRNSACNLLAATKHEALSERFMLWNDDFFALEPQAGIPLVYHVEPDITQSHFKGLYRKGALATEKLLREDGVTGPLHSYEMHVPFVYEKSKIRELLERVIAKNAHECIHWRSYYGNLHDIGGVPATDVKWRGGEGLPPYSGWLSSSPERWRLMLRDMHTTFPNKSRYER